MRAEKVVRNRVDIDIDTKLILDDMVERGFFRDTLQAIEAAVTALQVKLADDTHSDLYYDEDHQADMTRLQLSIGNT